MLSLQAILAGRRNMDVIYGRERGRRAFNIKKLKIRRRQKFPMTAAEERIASAGNPVSNLVNTLIYPAKSKLFDEKDKALFSSSVISKVKQRSAPHTVESSQYLGGATSALLLISTLTFGFAVAAIIELAHSEVAENELADSGVIDEGSKNSFVNILILLLLSAAASLACYTTVFGLLEHYYIQMVAGADQKLGLDIEDLVDMKDADRKSAVSMVATRRSSWSVDPESCRSSTTNGREISANIVFSGKYSGNDSRKHSATDSRTCSKQTSNVSNSGISNQIGEYVEDNDAKTLVKSIINSSSVATTANSNPKNSPQSPPSSDDDYLLPTKSSINKSCDRNDAFKSAVSTKENETDVMDDAMELIWSHDSVYKHILDDVHHVDKDVAPDAHHGDDVEVNLIDDDVIETEMFIEGIGKQQEHTTNATICDTRGYPRSSSKTAPQLMVTSEAQVIPIRSGGNSLVSYHEKEHGSIRYEDGITCPDDRASDGEEDFTAETQAVLERRISDKVTERIVLEEEFHFILMCFNEARARARNTVWSSLMSIQLAIVVQLNQRVLEEIPFLFISDIQFYVLRGFASVVQILGVITVITTVVEFRRIYRPLLRKYKLGYH